MTSLNIMAQLEQNQANELRLLMEKQTFSAEDFSQQGEGLDIEQQDMENLILGSVPTPQDDCCYLFNNKNYGGDRKWICHWGEPVERELYDPIYNFNDVAESFVCGKNTKVTFCDNEFYRCNHINSSSGRINNPDMGQWMNNKLSTLKIEPYDVVHRPAANLYNYRDCAGEQAAFEYLGQEGRTEYTSNDLKDAGLPGDSVSSVRVPRGYVLEVYADDGARG